MRLPYNGVCIIGAWLAWTFSNELSGAIDEKPAAHLSDPGAALELIGGFAVLNIAYSLVYAVEYVVLARQRQSWGRGAHLALLVAGSIFGFCIAGRGAASIAANVSTQKRDQLIIELNRQRLRDQAPNQSLEPTR